MYARAKLHAVKFRCAIIVGDSSRVAGPKTIESQRRKRARSASHSATKPLVWEGPPDGSGDVTGREFAFPWAATEPAHPVGRDANRVYSSTMLKLVEFRLRRYLNRTLQQRGWAVLRLRHEQTAIISCDATGSADSVVVWSFDTDVGTWVDTHVGGIRATNTADGEADVLSALLLTYVSTHASQFGFQGKAPQSMASFSCDSDWILIWLLWLAYRRYDSKTAASALHWKVHWFKKAATGKKRGQMLVLNVHTLLDRLTPIQAAERFLKSPSVGVLETALNFSTACVSYGCDFVQHGKGYCNNIRSMGKVADVLARIQSTLPLRLTVGAYHAPAANGNSYLRHAIAVGGDSIADLQKVLTLGSNKVALTETQCRNAVWTSVYWLAASIGNEAIQRACPDSSHAACQDIYARAGFCMTPSSGRHKMKFSHAPNDFAMAQFPFFILPTPAN